MLNLHIPSCYNAAHTSQQVPKHFTCERSFESCLAGRDAASSMARIMAEQLAPSRRLSCGPTSQPCNPCVQIRRLNHVAQGNLLQLNSCKGKLNSA